MKPFGYFDARSRIFKGITTQIALTKIVSHSIVVLVFVIFKTTLSKSYLFYFNILYILIVAILLSI